MIKIQNVGIVSQFDDLLQHKIFTKERSIAFCMTLPMSRTCL